MSSEHSGPHPAGATVAHVKWSRTLRVTVALASAAASWAAVVGVTYLIVQIF
ncbi:MAG TPA: hypothetical protein VGU67_00775 [Edaphobacter sp.]|nr:hypothetical protein [Edaphobacter sp.]